MNNGKICISVFARTAERLIEQIRLAEHAADVIEVRFDHLDESECTTDSLNRVFAAKSEKPWIATFRSPDQGGARELTIEQRYGFWAQNATVEFIDLEEDLLRNTFFNGSRVIGSFHAFAGLPKNIDEIYDRLARLPVDVIKIAYSATEAVDTIPIWRLLDRARTDSRDLIPIAMGDAGKFTRVLGLAHGAFLTYASLDAGTATAPGQVTAKDLDAVYRAKEHGRDTRVFGVIGDPISQSMSPYMHNPAFAAAGIDAVFVPLLVKDIAEFMCRMVRADTREVELNFGGFSVTMPHKQSIMPYLDAITPMAAAIGAVNTVRIENGKLTGFNTDADGFMTPLVKKIGSVADSRVAVFGAGGAARAVVYALKEARAEVTVFARNGDKASDLATEFGVAAGFMSSLQGTALGTSFDILIDTTPLGMKGPLEKETLFTAEELVGLELVYDLVTKAAETPILLEARRAGVPGQGGVDMLVAQGARQFEIWTDMRAPIEVMRSAVDARMDALSK